MAREFVMDDAAAMGRRRLGAVTALLLVAIATTMVIVAIMLMGAGQAGAEAQPASGRLSDFDVSQVRDIPAPPEPKPKAKSEPEPVAEPEPEPEPVQEAVDDAYDPEWQDDGGYGYGYDPAYDDAAWASGSDGASYDADYLRSMGVVYDEGYRYTWYSQNVLPGGGLDIPGRSVDANGYVTDGDGNICLASSDLAYGTVVETPFGTGVVYDSGCASGTLDVYTAW